MFQVLSFSPKSVDGAAIVNFLLNPPVTNEFYYAGAYYWRDFDNHVPFDAFSAGDDKDMLPIFIGQILDKDSLFPSTVEIEKNTYTGFVKKNNIKIICSNYPQYLELKKIDDPKMLRNNNVIVGGYEKSDFLYIGRRISKGEILVGKLISINGQYQLHSVQNDEIVIL